MHELVWWRVSQPQRTDQLSKTDPTSALCCIRCWTLGVERWTFSAACRVSTPQHRKGAWLPPSFTLSVIVSRLRCMRSDVFVIRHSSLTLPCSADRRPDLHI